MSGDEPGGGGHFRSGLATGDETLGDDELAPTEAGGLARGEALGRYVIVDRIGAGAMGVVYSAYDPRLDRRVALKLLHARGTSEAEDRRAQRLLREAQAMAKLTHPNVVTVHDVGAHGGRVFVAMEHVQGRTLATWMRESPPWRRVLEVFVAAGRGLAAAHEKGLVHRDFKPDNVMIGDDGRVLVMDFGIARADDTDESAPLRDAIAPATDAVLPLTRTGAIMGTPAYMAPEQLRALGADARSDQFAFCVALYEGLYGVRPFQGGTLAALVLAVTAGEVAEPPPGRAVPKWLRQALLRGLSPVPTDRFEDMGHLLRVLQAHPTRRARVTAWVGAAAVLGLALVWGASQSADSADQVCRGAERHLQSVWDAQRADRVEAAIRATGSPVAKDTTERVIARLDRYAQSWIRMRADNCEATRLRAEQSEADMDLRNACLDQRLRNVRELVAVLERADADVVQRAVGAVADLAPLEGCADLAAIHGELAPPDDVVTADAVRSLRERLGRLHALTMAGAYDEARQLAGPLVAEAETVGYEAVAAEAHLLQGELLVETGESASAEEALSKGYFEALHASHDEVAAKAAALLTYVVGYRLARHDEGFRWGDHALSMALRVGADGLAEANALHNLGVLANAAGDLEGASQHYERAYALRSSFLDPDHPDLGRSLNSLGNVHLGRGEYDEALRNYRDSLKLRERVFGPAHPEVAGALNNVSLVLRRRGAFAEAGAALRRAVSIYESVLGQSHPDVAQSIDNLGLVLRESGDPVAAELEHRRALEMRRRTMGPQHPDVADSLKGLGRALVDQTQYDRAEECLSEALDLYERAFGFDHPAVADALIGLGLAHLGRNRNEAAAAAFERALGIRRAKSPGSDDEHEAAALLARARG